MTRFVSPGTIEGRIAEVLEKKRQLFPELIAQNGTPTLGLSEHEIFGLFDIQAIIDMEGTLWAALMLPAAPGRWQARHQEENRWLQRLEFRTLVNTLMRLPCQIVRRGRRLVYRLLRYPPALPVLFRLLARLRC